MTIHQHLARDLNGNVIVGNTLINNNLDPDQDFAAVVDPVTTGILVESGSPPGPALPPFLVPGPIKNMVIAGNRFFAQKIGIFTLGVDLTSTTIAHNVFGPGVKPIVPN